MTPRSCTGPSQDSCEAEAGFKLGPGDVVYFPTRWAHYTEALPAPAAAAGEDAEDAEDAMADEDAEDAGLSFSLGFRTDGEFLVS